MTIEDQVFLEITIWKENRGGGIPGMQSVANVIINRANKRGTSIFDECVSRLQFSSMTSPGDPGLVIWPSKLASKNIGATDLAAWIQAKQLALNAANGVLVDITGGADDYYAPAAMAIDETVPYTLPDGTKTVFPKDWNQSAVRFTVEIADQLFFVSV